MRGSGYCSNPQPQVIGQLKIHYRYVPSEPFCDDPGSSRAPKSQAVTEESEAHTPDDTGHLPGVVVGFPLTAR